MNLGRYGVLRFVVNNNSKADFPARSIHVFPIGEIHSRAGSVQIDDQPAVDSSGFEAVFPRDQRVKAAVSVNNPDTVRTSLRMIVHGNLSALTAIKVIDLRPEDPRGRKWPRRFGAWFYDAQRVVHQHRQLADIRHLCRRRARVSLRRHAHQRDIPH